MVLGELEGHLALEAVTRLEGDGVGPRWARRLAGLVLVGSVATLALGTGPALAQPCWKRLINDWWDGRIDNVYPIACYRAAMANAPEDLQAYSDLQSDLRRALAAATALRRRENTYVVPADTGGSQGGGEAGRSGRDAAQPPALASRPPT